MSKKRFDNRNYEVRGTLSLNNPNTNAPVYDSQLKEIQNQGEEKKATQGRKSNRSLFGVKLKSKPNVDVNDIWKNDYINNRATIIFLLLLYVFSSDDGIIDKNELKILKKVLKLEGQYFTDTHIDLVSSFVEEQPNLDYVIEFLNHNNVSRKVFDDATEKAKKVLPLEKHKNVLNELLHKY